MEEKVRTTEDCSRATSVSESESNPHSIKTVSEPRALDFSRRGIKTGDDFANFMSALMSDAVEGALSPQIVNAAVNAGGKLLKVVEMQYKYGRSTGTNPPLQLATGSGQVS